MDLPARHEDPVRGLQRFERPDQRLPLLQPRQAPLGTGPGRPACENACFMTSPLSHIPRFHVPFALATGEEYVLPGDAGRHASRALRLRAGDAIALFNGAGGEFEAKIARITRDEVVVVSGPQSPIERESPLLVTLVQGISSGDRMDLTIQKAVELGVTAIQPVLAERSVVKLSRERGNSRREHWQRVAASACEQCGRNRLPHLAEPADFGQWIRQQDLHRRVLLSPRGSTSLSDWARHHPPQALTILIGPEGGFSDVEESTALAHGALCLTMGERILRTETAGLAALSIVQAHWS